ncbi:MAG: hypothetical protein AAGI30_06370 [Planctomycetota bacterium]
MAKGRNRPALYEVIAERPRGVSYRAPAARPQTYDEPDTPHDEDRVLWLSPGHALRIPVGVVIAAAAVAIGVAVATYVIGFGRGREDVIQEFDSLRQTGGIEIIDPLESDQDAGAGPTRLRTIREILEDAPLAEPEPARSSQIPGSDTTDTSPTSTTGPRLVVVDRWEDDPRQVGLNYFVLAYIRAEDAEHAARFLVEQGVSAARLPANSRGLASVIALRGFEPGTLGEPEAVSFERQLKQLGRRYKAEGGGATDFSDAYPERFD